MNITELNEIRENFTKELELARSGKKTSLPFIENQLPSQPLVGDDKEFEVLVIGGSIFIKAICIKERGQIIITGKQTGEKPRFDTEADLMAFAEKYIDPDIDHVALNFAYPLQPAFSGHKLDGVLIKGTKENKFEGLQGKAVGECIEKHLFDRRKQKVTVSVANDTVCTLLSGISDAYSPEYLACGIVGTGVNFAFFTDTTHAINLESANFDKFTQSEYGKRIDEASQEPGAALFEKETSGGYLYQHFNLFAKDHGIGIELPASRELDEYAQKCELGANAEGRLCEFASGLLDRSAALIATQVAGITAYKKTDMSFIMAGSMFWKGWSYKENVTRYVKRMIPEYDVTFISVNTCEIYGAAKLVA
jgi:hexokinase